MTQEALKLALKALEDARAALAYIAVGNAETNPRLAKSTCKHGVHAIDKVVPDIKEALAQPEPCDMGDICIGCSPRNADGSCPSSQRKFVGLTDDEMEATFIQCGGRWNGDFWEIEDADFHPHLRTIEAKLKEKNT